jgi:hypothetical protein
MISAEGKTLFAPASMRSATATLLLLPLNESGAIRIFIARPPAANLLYI